MEYWKEVLAGLRKHFHLATVMGKADFIVSDWNQYVVLPKTAKVKIGGTTYRYDVHSIIVFQKRRKSQCIR